MPALLRGLGRWDLVFLMVNSTIGAGILGLPGKVYALVGIYSVLACLAGGILVGLVGACYAEASSRYPGTGATILYARAAFGPAAGFAAGVAGGDDQAVRLCQHLQPCRRLCGRPVAAGRRAYGPGGSDQPAQPGPGHGDLSRGDTIGRRKHAIHGCQTDASGGIRAGGAGVSPSAASAAPAPASAGVALVAGRRAAAVRANRPRLSGGERRGNAQPKAGRAFRAVLRSGHGRGALYRHPAGVRGRGAEPGAVAAAAVRRRSGHARHAWRRAGGVRRYRVDDRHLVYHPVRGGRA